MSDLAGLATANRRARGLDSAVPLPGGGPKSTAEDVLPDGAAPLEPSETPDEPGGREPGELEAGAAPAPAPVLPPVPARTPDAV